MSVIKKIVAQYRLDNESNVVDFGALGGEIYYYSAFEHAITDINNSSADLGGANYTNAVCCVVYNNATGVPILRLLTDVFALAAYTISKDMILDLNGYCLNFDYATAGEILDSETGAIQNTYQICISEEASVVIYGMSDNSKISQTKTDSVFTSTHIVIFNNNGKYLGVFGGEYSFQADYDKKIYFFYSQTGTTVLNNCTINMEDVTDRDSDSSRIVAAIYTHGDFLQIKNCIFKVNQISPGYAYGMYCFNVQNSILSSTFSITSKTSEGERGHAVCNGIQASINTTSPLRPKTLIKDCTISAESGTYKYDTTDSKGNPIYAGEGYDNGTGINNYGTMWLINNNVFGVHSSVSNRNTIYVVSGEYKSPSHGFYNSWTIVNGVTTYALAYIMGGTFTHTADPDNLYPNKAYSAAYIGYGSVAYINNATFTSEQNQCSIAFNQRTNDSSGGNEKASTVYISNSTCNNIVRCPAVNSVVVNSIIYVGDGCNDFTYNNTYETLDIITTPDVTYEKEIPAVSLKPLDDILIDLDASKLNLSIALILKGIEASDNEGLVDLVYKTIDALTAG